MTPSDHFVLFYNEIFKFLARRGPEALRKYYKRVADRQAFFTLEAFKRDGLKGMYDYWERIRIEENCQMRNAYDDVHYEAEMLRCPSLSKALESDAGACPCYCDHCPGWVIDVIGRAGYYCVYDMVGRDVPSCRYAVYKDRALAEERFCQCVAAHGADVVRTNLSLGQVHGCLAESDRFVGLHPRLAKAFDFLRANDLSKLSLGRHEVDGDKIYANVMEVDLAVWRPEAKLEAHRRYIDIQLPISGSETIGYAYDARAEKLPLKGDGDIVIFENRNQRPLRLDPGDFAVFFPSCGAHSPGQCVGAPRRIRKVVVKVLA